MTLSICQTDDIAACHALRRIVFIEEQGVPEADEVDALDHQAFHLLAQDVETAVGTARILIKGDIAKIGRVCVLQSHRSTGTGAALINAAIALARTQPRATRARLDSQLHALGFYEKLGFSAFGPVYDDAGIAHRDMERSL